MAIILCYIETYVLKYILCRGKQTIVPVAIFPEAWRLSTFCVNITRLAQNDRKL